MSLFKRRKDADVATSSDETADATVPASGADADAEESLASAAPAQRSGGPHDVADVPQLEGRVDLGAVRLALTEGMELRLEVEEGTGRVVSAQVVHGGSAVQLQAFAAPRSEGIWDAVRHEIAAGITQQGGTADDVPGPFGTELLARVPGQMPDGRTGYQVLRFVGVNGPRWFVRAVFSGDAATTTEAAEALESVVRGTVVVRGEEPLPPRALLELRLPDEASAQPAEEPQAGQDARDPLRPFERGPEITERR